jgi:hypothetical protein
LIWSSTGHHQGGEIGSTTVARRPQLREIPGVEALVGGLLMMMPGLGERMQQPGGVFARDGVAAERPSGQLLEQADRVGPALLRYRRGTRLQQRTRIPCARAIAGLERIRISLRLGLELRQGQGARLPAKQRQSQNKHGSNATVTIPPHNHLRGWWLK